MVWCCSDRMVILVIMAVILCGATTTTVHSQAPTTSGVFRLGKSCHPSSTEAAVEERTDFSIEQPVWMRTDLPVTLEAKDKNQSCHLTENTVYKGKQEGWVEISNAMKADVDDCIFQSNTVLRLQEGYVQVSCKLDLLEAESEMKDGLPKSNSIQPSPEPRLLNFDVAPTANNPEVVKAITVNTSNEPSVEIRVSSTTPRSVTDGSSGDEQASSSTMNIVATTGPLLALLSTASETEAANVLESTTIGTEATTDEPQATSVSTTATEDNHPTTVLPTWPHLQNIKSSSATHNSGHHNLNNDHLPYFIGAGVCMLGLILGIIFIVCLVKRRTPKPKKTENNELFFIPGSYTDTMERLNYDSENSQDRHNKGSYNNAQVMYSGADPEYVESFDLEDKILNSQQSSSSEGPEVPKCLRKH